MDNIVDVDVEVEVTVASSAPAQAHIIGQMFFKNGPKLED